MVYLVHISPKFKHAGHYLGFSTDLAGRMEAHKAGRGARLLAAASAAGCRLRVVRKWSSAGCGKHFERRLKNSHQLKELCPVCSGAAAMARGRRANSTAKR